MYCKGAGSLTQWRRRRWSSPWRRAFCRVLHDLRDGGGLLADGHIDADHVLALLVQDGVHSQGGLAGLTVADDQLTLAAADGEHGVDGQNTGLQRLTLTSLRVMTPGALCSMGR